MRLLDWLSYPRAFVLTVLGLVWTLAMSVLILIVAFLIGKPAAIDFIIKLWSRPVLWACGIFVDVRGVEHVSRSRKGFIILFNHSSHLDVPILAAYFPRSFRFGAKIELFSIPFFGAAMRVCGVLPIDRRNRNKVMRVYEEAVSRIESGESFALAPEGTRQSEPKIGAFKRGPFEFAMNAQSDIVPVILAGAFAVLPRNSIWPNLGRWRRRVILEILPPVATKGYTREALEELQATVHAQMLEAHSRAYRELVMPEPFTAASAPKPLS